MKIDLEKGLSQLQQISSAIHPLNGSEWDAFSSVWQTLECKRKTVLTTVGETERYLYFVIDGIQRVYIPTKRKEKQPSYSCTPLLLQEY